MIKSRRDFLQALVAAAGVVVTQSVSWTEREDAKIQQGQVVTGWVELEGIGANGQKIVEICPVFEQGAYQTNRAFASVRKGTIMYFDDSLVGLESQA